MIVILLSKYRSFPPFVIVPIGNRFQVLQISIRYTTHKAYLHTALAWLYWFVFSTMLFFASAEVQVSSAQPEPSLHQ